MHLYCYFIEKQETSKRVLANEKNINTNSILLNVIPVTQIIIFINKLCTNNLQIIKLIINNLHYS